LDFNNKKLSIIAILGNFTINVFKIPLQELQQLHHKKSATKKTNKTISNEKHDHT